MFSNLQISSSFTGVKFLNDAATITDSESERGCPMHPSIHPERDKQEIETAKVQVHNSNKLCLLPFCHRLSGLKIIGVLLEVSCHVF